MLRQRFAAKPVRDALVFGTRQTLVPDGFGVETNFAEDPFAGRETPRVSRN